MIEMITLRKCPFIQAVFEELDPDVAQDLDECIQWWNLDEARKRFVDILEASIPART